MATETLANPQASTKSEGHIVLPSTKLLKDQYKRGVAIAAWAALCGYNLTTGSGTAMKAYGQVAGVLKGQDARTMVRLVKDADMEAVPTRLQLNKQKDHKANDDKLAKGDISEKTHKDRVDQINKKYTEAGAFWATFNRKQFLREVAIIRDHMNTLSTTVKAAGTGARQVTTIDSALNTIFGNQLTLKDAFNSIQLGLVVA